VVGVVLRLAVGLVQALARGLDKGGVAVGVALQLAQIGAGESHFGLQRAGLLVNRALVGANQIRRGLGGFFLGGMQGLFGTGQAIAQLAELSLIGAGLFGFLQFGALHRQFDLGLLQRFVAGRFARGGRCVLLRTGQRLFGVGQLGLKTRQLRLLLLVATLQFFQLA